MAWGESGRVWSRNRMSSSRSFTHFRSFDKTRRAIWRTILPTESPGMIIGIMIASTWSMHTAQGASNGKTFENFYAMRWESSTTNHLSWTHFPENASQVALDKCSDRITKGLNSQKLKYSTNHSIANLNSIKRNAICENSKETQGLLNDSCRVYILSWDVDLNVEIWMPPAKKPCKSRRSTTRNMERRSNIQYIITSRVAAEKHPKME